MRPFVIHHPPQGGVELADVFHLALGKVYLLIPTSFKRYLIQSDVNTGSFCFMLR